MEKRAAGAPVAFNPPSPPKDADALRIGIFGAARIAPNALITPALSHPGVVVAAVAARSPARAQAFAKKHGIAKVFNSYQELLDDPEIDAIYNPLPNGLHFEWTMKAIAAGKHVLLEKPSCDTADETRRVFAFAREKGVVVLEAFHYRFHPAAQRVREIVQSGALGKIKRMHGALAIPGLLFAEDDIRYDWALGGGCLMDMGVYPLSFVRFIAGTEPTSVISAAAAPAKDPRVDRATTALLALPDDVTASITCDFALPRTWGILPSLPRINMRVDCERGSVYIFNFVAPFAYHYISVTDAQGKTRTEKVYKPATASGKKGEEWWSTYRYQLEAFVDRIRGRTPDYWMEPEDSIAQMEAVEKIYEKSGLGVRPASAYVV
ncbi:NAD(P)-binding protein [Auricularia subglabra TFB-10046 SS5]|nr:NAD(P)-binding protein [Auricularia subglabra TFB-10046 SS5]